MGSCDMNVRNLYRNEVAYIVVLVNKYLWMKQKVSVTLPRSYLSVTRTSSSQTSQILSKCPDLRALCV